MTDRLGRFDNIGEMPIMMLLGVRGHFAFEAIQQNSDSGQNALHQAGKCLAVSLAGRLLDEGRSVVKSGIYQIRNRINGRRYVGSAVNVQCRWREHLGRLRRGVHCNPHLQAAFDKYGEDAFQLEVLESVVPRNLIEREQHYLDAWEPEYNIALIAGMAMLGRHHSEETKRKMREASKRRLPISAETRRRMGEASKGRQSSKEHRRKLSEALKGRQKTDEHRRNISKGLRGRILSAEHRGNISDALKGKGLSEEHCRKISAGLQAYWQRIRISENHKGGE